MNHSFVVQVASLLVYLFCLCRRGKVEGRNADFTSIAFTEVNICIVTVDLYSTTALVLNSTAPFSDLTYLVANCNYLIGFDDMVVAMQSRKHLFCIPFFDCVPTGIQSFRRYLKRTS